MPQDAIATAMPRRRSNQCEMSLMIGPNDPELPNPIRPCASANCQRLAAMPDSTKPSPRQIAPKTIGRMTPKRSASRPIRTPPAPKPTMVSVNGSDASPRLTPKSVCIAGSTTMNDHMPTPPMVPVASAAQSRIQAALESTSLAGAGPA